jgi:sulfopyruvate decarboxylase alpha subunit
MSEAASLKNSPEWPDQIFDVFRDNHVRHIAFVPDAGHARLIRRCEGEAEMTTVCLTTEEEGVGLLAGSWLGGVRGALLIQSSGVGNCINMLALPKLGKFPLLMLVTMRGQWGEAMSWQIPMGQATRTVLEAMGVIVYEAQRESEVRETVEAATWMAFRSSVAVAVLLTQRLIGPKNFEPA